MTTQSIATYRGIEITRSSETAIQRSQSSDPRAFGRLGSVLTVRYCYPIGVFALGFSMGHIDDTFAISEAKSEIDRYLGPA